MGLFDQFPYTNFHELNLDWILRALKELEHTIDQFVSINALKYADPIQWNITKQYEKNTIVIDPLTGTAYISVQPVPSGVALTRDEYWTVVFDLGSFVVRAAKNFTDRWESQWTLTATFPSNIGDWLVWNDTLYKVISNIVAGDQYVIDSNIKHFTIEDIIGHLEELDTTDKSNLVAAINEILQTLADTTGDLADLNTTDKSNLVAAINEVLQTLTDTTGDLADLNTTDKSNLVAAINELDIDIANNRFINALVAGAKGDGVTDDTIALQTVLASGNNLYLPKGVYLISDTLNLTNQMIMGAGEESIIRMTVDTVNTIIGLGSRSYLFNFMIGYDESLDLTGAASFSDFVGISTKSPLNAYGFQRSGLDHVIIRHVGNGFSNQDTGCFSTQLSNMEITDFTYCGIAYPEGSTGDLLSNVYINNGVDRPGENTADLKTAHYGIYVVNNAHLICNNVNVEWSRLYAAIYADNSNICGSGIHIEEVSTRANYNGIIQLNRTDFNVQNLEFYYPWFYTYEGTGLIYLFDAGFNIDATTYNDVSSVHIGTLTLVGLNNPDSTIFPALNRGMQYAAIYYNHFNRANTRTGTYLLDIDNYEYINYIAADDPAYTDFIISNDITARTLGYHPKMGSFANRPTKNLCNNFTEYYDTDSHNNYRYFNNQWNADPYYEDITGTPDSNFNSQAFQVLFSQTNLEVVIRLQGDLTSVVGTVGTITNNSIYAIGLIMIAGKAFSITIASGVITLGNPINYDPVDIPDATWFSTRCILTI